MISCLQELVTSLKVGAVDTMEEDPSPTGLGYHLVEFSASKAQEQDDIDLTGLS